MPWLPIPLLHSMCINKLSEKQWTQQIYLLISKYVLASLIDDSGYPHDGRADKNPYPHDRRADMILIRTTAIISALS